MIQTTVSNLNQFLTGRELCVKNSFIFNEFRFLKLELKFVIPKI